MNNTENAEKVNEKSKVESKQGAAPDDGHSWKKVTISGMTGILLGAGAGYAVNSLNTEVTANNHIAGSSANSTVHDPAPIYNEAPMAHVNDNMSFSEAFAAARAEVGPGGVFVWRGGVYGTYYADEWNSMSEAQQNEFAQSVNYNEIPHSTPSQNVTTTHVHEPQTPIDPDPPVKEDEEIEILSIEEVEGHDALILDTTSDGEPDLMLIDVDDSQSITNPDVVIDTEGMMTTVGDIAAGNPPVPLDEDSFMQASVDDPMIDPGVVDC